ncbi:type VI secretion system membrane subunit TssM [Sphingomonas gilva]|uniref:Type VI secretion system membrane subunit TssM n=1 Tax=Sphingomonas gilva TaxID=2305907 RepID=A0A396RL05_9SPHN|nr:type VI secretion system membrane subunit TssM [Sphingomonas gilva]RHW17004.1 type VI secretion system membrane subunit TssM [Sphingomonas gilva]
MYRFMRNWWTVSIFCTVLIAAIFGFLLPMFSTWFATMWIRVSFVLLSFAILGFAAFWRWRKAKKANDAIANELAQPSAADEESKALALRMAEALKGLKEASGKQRGYLYNRPWYVIIGPPGAGKTTALLNSGLRFPFAEQALKGVGGTRNLDFWFADEAAMVDTAGRYTTQDSDAAVDQRGWFSFLELMKKHRPLQPINGVIVAIGVDELIRADCAKIDAHAAAVRRRLGELRKTLEVAAPVYVMLTKADLLAGFVEYYDDLDVEGRRAVLGATVTYADGKPTAEALARAFDEMAQAVADRQAKRLFEEQDLHRRSLLLGFPSQLQSLRSRLMRFLDGAFPAGAEPAGVLRGFYLTSGVQEGAPLDRILSGMADVYDRPQTGGGSGRAYFLNRLLTETMFPEAGLVTMDPKARARQKTKLVGALAAVAAISVLTLGAWGVSFAKNRSFQNDLLAKSTEANGLFKQSGVDLQEVRDSDADLRAALPGLNAMRALPYGYAQRRASGPPLTMRFGLFQRSLSREAEEAYRESLRRILLPRVLLRLEQYMQANAGDPMRLYEPLKVYLMLGSQGPMDRKAVQSFVTTDWATEVYPGSDANQERNQLAQHLAALLEDENLASVWEGRRAPLDGNLVASARAAVQTLSLADRAYAVMKQKAATQGQAWLMANVLTQGDALAFSNPDQVLTTQVPYFFTREGYEKSYLLGLATVQADLEKDLWVMGGDANSQGIQSEMGNVRPGVAGLYAKDYIAAWDNVVNVMQPGPYFANPAAFGAFTKMPSPLKRVLLELRRNTIFSGGLRGGAAAIAKQRLGSSRIGNYANAALRDRAQQIDAGAEITAYFTGVHEYVGDGKGAAPIDDFVGAVKEAGQAVMAAQSVGGGGGSEATQAQMATAMASVAAAAAGAPAQLQGFVSEAAKGGSSAQTSAAQGAVSDAYAQSVMPACREVAQERYPFFGGAQQDAAVVDMLRVFGMGGTIDGFVTQRLRPMMQTEGPIWRWNPDDPVAATLAPGSPEEFAKAGEIRDLLVGGLPLKVAVASFGSEVGAVEFASGGANYRFARDSNQPKPILWSVSGGLPTASVTLFGQDGKQELRKFEAEGPWALFRLMDQADKENAGAQALKASFGEGGRTVTFQIALPSENNPFSRGGLWSFRCPTAL